MDDFDRAGVVKNLLTFAGWRLMATIRRTW
jgi:hypothetical protein